MPSERDKASENPYDPPRHYCGNERSEHRWGMNGRSIRIAEVVVLIAILVVLAAILIPVFAARIK